MSCLILVSCFRFRSFCYSFGRNPKGFLFLYDEENAILHCISIEWIAQCSVQGRVAIYFQPIKKFQIPRNVCTLGKNFFGWNIDMNVVYCDTWWLFKKTPLLSVIGWNAVIGRDRLARNSSWGKSIQKCSRHKQKISVFENIFVAYIPLLSILDNII